MKCIVVHCIKSGTLKAENTISVIVVHALESHFTKLSICRLTLLHMFMLK